MKALPWKISSTLLLLTLLVGVQYSKFLADRGNLEVIRLVGNSHLPQAVEFIQTIWVKSPIWYSLFGLVLVAIATTWIPKISWLGSIFTLVATLTVMFFLSFIPIAYWTTNHAAVEVLSAKIKEAKALNPDVDR